MLLSAHVAVNHLLAGCTADLLSEFGHRVRLVTAEFIHRALMTVRGEIDGRRFVVVLPRSHAHAAVSRAPDHRAILTIFSKRYGIVLRVPAVTNDRSEER